MLIIVFGMLVLVFCFIFLKIHSLKKAQFKQLNKTAQIDLNISYDRESQTSEFYEDPRVSEVNSISDLSIEINVPKSKKT